MITGYDIVVEAEEWIGTKWQHQQSLKGIASDCIGLIRGVARGVGVPDIDRFDTDSRFQGYGRTPNPRVLLEGCNEYLDPVQPARIDLGDIAIIRFRDWPMHFAFIAGLEPTYLIHALGTVGRVVKHRVDDVWDARIMRVYRFRGLA